MNISVTIGKAIFQNPVTVASGTFGHSQKYYDLEEVQQLGALTPKTVTLKAREGNPPPRIFETPSGMLNAIGIENPGADGFIKSKLPALKKTGIPLIISVLGHTDKEFEMLTEKFNAVSGVSAIELNLSCPNLGKKVLAAQDPMAAYRIVKAVKKISRYPVIAKLSPNVTDVTMIARAAAEAGADALSLINTLLALAVDAATWRPRIATVTGGLSGPAVKPVALRMVLQVRRALPKMPIIGLGGIMTAEDAAEFLLCGASAVQIGTANYVDPKTSLTIVQGLARYAAGQKVSRMSQLVGTLRDGR